MYKVNFYLKGALSTQRLTTLKKTNALAYQAELNELKPIIISVVRANRRYVITTKKKVAQRFWNSDEKTIKLLKDTPANAKALKSWIASTKAKIEAALDAAIAKGNTVDKNFLMTVVHGEQPNVALQTWEDAIKIFLYKHKTLTGDALKANTKKKYLCLQKHIIDFQGNSHYNLSNINNDWIYKFKSYLLHVKKLTDNSVCKYLRGLKTYIKETCRNSKLTLDVNLTEIKTTEKAPLVHILKVEEVKAIKNHVFEKDEYNAIRDVFLFQCYTGQRYSDIEKITWDNIQMINGNKAWVLDTVKTNDHITVPLTKDAQVIIAKYNGHAYPLPRLTNQYVNRELKNIGKAVGLNRKVKVIKYRDNVREECFYLISDIISTHMARKTFISNSLQHGIPERAIREVSGHRDEKSFKRYIDLDNSHHKMILDVWDDILK